VKTSLCIPYFQMRRTRDDKQARPNGNHAWARGFLTGMRNLVNERGGGDPTVFWWSQGGAEGHSADE